MKERKVKKYIILVVETIAFFMLCYLFLMSIFGTSLIGNANGEIKRYYLPDRWWLHILIWGFLVLAFVALGQILKKPPYIHRFTLYIIYFVAGVTFIFCAREYPISDPGKVYEIAKSISIGDVSSYVNTDG